MASNPMQRKARNSFLAGIALATLILGSIIAFLLFQEYQSNKEQEAIENAKTMVYVLSQDVKSGANVAIKDDQGSVIPQGLKLVEVSNDVVPTTAITAVVALTDITENTLFKIDLKAGTILTKEMLTEAEDLTTKDVREQEYNMLIVPTYLEKDDYVDIRLRLPNGEDYIVVSKKKVVDTDETTIWMNMREDEIITLSNAIVEAYKMLGSELYATTYVEPGTQDAATVTYVPSETVIKLIEADPNVIEKAKTALRERYNISTLWEGRTQNINPIINGMEPEQALNNVSEGVSASTEARKQAREEYLKELEAAATAASTAATTGTTTTK